MSAISRLTALCGSSGYRVPWEHRVLGEAQGLVYLPLVSREWRNGNYYKYHYYQSSIPY